MADGIQADRPTAIQIAPLATIGEGNQPPPAIQSFMDAYRSGFITVDDLQRRARQEPLEISQVKTGLQAEDFRRRRLAEAEQLAPGQFEIAKQTQALQAGQIPLAETEQDIQGRLLDIQRREISQNPEERRSARQEKLQMEYEQLSGSQVPEQFVVPSQEKPLTFEQWSKTEVEPKIVENVNALQTNQPPGSTADGQIRADYEAQLRASIPNDPNIQAEYNAYLEKTRNTPTHILKGTDEYDNMLRKQVEKLRTQAGTQAAFLKALPGILEQRAKVIAELPAQQAKLAQDYFKDYDNGQEIKDLRKVQAAYNKIKNSITPTSTPPQDMSAIFSFMKILDPGSTVREGEYATAQNARGIPATVANYYNQLINGVKLTPKQRQQFLEAAEGNLQGQVIAALPRIKQFRQKELDLDLPSGSVVPVEDTEFIAKFGAPGAAAAPGATGAPSATAGSPAGKPKQVIQNGFIYELQPDGTYK